MASFLFPHLARVVAQVQAPQLLHALFAPYRDFFATHLGSDANELVDADALARLPADVDLPERLAEDLCFIAEMATPAAMDQLLQQIDGEHAPLQRWLLETDAVTPADVAAATRVWAPQLLERVHAEQAVRRRRKFVYLCARKGIAAPRATLSSRQWAILKEQLGETLAQRKRSASVEVFSRMREQRLVVIVRRGDPLKVEGAIDEDGASRRVRFRPEVYDLIEVDPETRELAINTNTPRLLGVYRTVFGEHLFDDAEALPHAKYTMKPLRAGAESLVCSDIPGLEWARLIHVRLVFDHGEQIEHVDRRAPDLFRCMTRTGHAIPPDADIHSATFRLKFAGARAPRTVKLEGASGASYTRNEDAELVETWLIARGFCAAPGTSHAIAV